MHGDLLEAAVRKQGVNEQPQFVRRPLAHRRETPALEQPGAVEDAEPRTDVGVAEVSIARRRTARFPQRTSAGLTCGRRAVENKFLYSVSSVSSVVAIVFTTTWTSPATRCV